MGNTRSRRVKVEVYKWSSAEFDEEYALIYTSLDDESNTATFRLSANKDKILCRLADNLCKQHPARFHMEITAETDSNGYYNFREVMVVTNGIPQDRIPQHDAVFFSYHCDKRLGYITVKAQDQNIGRVNNLNKTIWEVCHSYDIGFKSEHKYFVTVQCSKMAGLYVKFSGPFIYTGLVLQKRQSFQVDREILGEPPKAFVANVDTKLEGELHVLFQRGKRNSTISVQAMGLVNNIGGQTQGNCNGSVFYNCQFYAAP